MPGVVFMPRKRISRKSNLQENDSPTIESPGATENGSPNEARTTNGFTGEEMAKKIAPGEYHEVAPILHWARMQAQSLRGHHAQLVTLLDDFNNLLSPLCEAFGIETVPVNEVSEKSVANEVCAWDEVARDIEGQHDEIRLLMQEYFPAHLRRLSMLAQRLVGGIEEKR